MLFYHYKNSYLPEPFLFPAANAAVNVLKFNKKIQNSVSQHIQYAHHIKPRFYL